MSEFELVDLPAATYQPDNNKSWMQGPTGPEGQYDPTRLGHGTQPPPGYDGMQTVGTTPMAPLWGGYMGQPGGGALPLQNGGMSPNPWAQTYGGGLLSNGGPAYGGGQPMQAQQPIQGMPGMPGMQQPQSFQQAQAGLSGGGNFTGTGYNTINPSGFFGGMDMQGMFEAQQKYMDTLNPYLQPETKNPWERTAPDAGPESNAPKGFWQSVTSGAEINPRTRSEYRQLPQQLTDGWDTLSEKDQGWIQHRMTRPADDRMMWANSGQ